MRVAYVVCALLISFEKKEITKIFQSKWISPCSCYYIKKERDMWCVRIKTERIKVHTAEQVQQTNKKQKESENENNEGKKKMKQQL